MSLTSTAANWIASLKWEDIPEDVIQLAKICFRDHLGCAAGGARSTPGRISTRAALEWAGRPDATIVGAPTKVAARNAAFANGMMANALDFDDTLFGHPGSTTFSTSLAAAEKWGASGKEFLLASIAGYEFTTRAAALLTPIVPRYLEVWDAGAVQAFGAAASAARLGKLDARGTANALGIISATAPVPLPRKTRFPGEGRSMIKSCHGWTASAAIVAVEMTLAGMSGPGHVFDGNMGFWKVAPSAELGVADFADKLGELWSIRQIAFKPYMSCRFIHPVLQGIEEMQQGIQILADEIDQVEVSSFSLLADEHHWIKRPVSITDAQFSVPYVAAAMLREGTVTPESYGDENLTDPDVLALMDRVIVNVDEEYDQAYPEKLGAQVKITFKNGKTEVIRIDDPKGSPDRPMTETELQSKFESLAVPLLGLEQTNELERLIDRIEELPNLEPLSRLLSGERQTARTY